MQSVEVPLQDVPAEVVTVTSKFLEAKDSATLSSLACKLADAVFEDVPESSSSKVTAPKTKVTWLIPTTAPKTAPKTKVTWLIPTDLP